MINRTTSVSPGRGILALGVTLVVLVIDQLTKRWAVESLTTSCSGPGDHCIDLPGVTLRLVYNPGAAFSTGTGVGPLLGMLALAVCLGLMVMVWFSTSRFQAVLLGAVLGGALGNIVDRLVRGDDGLLSGSVIDFIDLGWWPVFNLADSAIVGGVIGLMAMALLAGDDPLSDSDPAGDGPDNTVLNDTVLNDTVLNDTALNDTVLNDTESGRDQERNDADASSHRPGSVR